MSIALISVLGAVVLAVMVLSFLSVRNKDRLIESNNESFRHMAMQFSLQLRLQENEALEFAELAMKNDDNETDLVMPPSSRKRRQRISEMRSMGDMEDMSVTPLSTLTGSGAYDG